MRKIAAAVSTLFMLGGVASAADMPIRQYSPPPVAELSTWTGFYIGGNGGGAFGSNKSDFNVGGGPTFASIDLATKGAIGGAQVGYNWQTGAMVLGVEADFQASGLKGDISTPCIPPFCGLPLTASYEQSVTWFGTARARAGYAQSGWLLYATGGYAYGRTETNASATAGPVTAAVKTDNINSGWTVGGGAEVMFAPRWSVKVEYLYVDLGKTTNSYVFTGLPTLNDTTHVSFNVFRAGVNFRF